MMSSSTAPWRIRNSRCCLANKRSPSSTATFRSSYWPQTSVSQELPENRPEKSEIASGVFVTRNRINGYGTAREILHFINKIENDPRLVAVKGFRVTAGAPKERSADEADEYVVAEDIEHQLELDLETYFYEPPKKSAKPLTIPGAERRLKEKHLVERVRGFRPEKAKTYVLASAASRRDPLVDPRRPKPVTEDVDTAEARTAQEQSVVRLEALWMDIEELMEQENALHEVGDVIRADRARSKIGEKASELDLEIARLIQSGAITLPDLRQRLASLRVRVAQEKRMKKAQKTVVTRSFAEAEQKRMTDLFEACDYKGLSERGRDWQVFLGRYPAQPAARPVLEEIATLLRKGTDLADWSKLRFEIRSTIVDRAAPERSMANINGARYRSGDALESNKEVIVDEITRSKVWFTFRGMRHPVAVGARKAAEDDK